MNKIFTYVMCIIFSITVCANQPVLEQKKSVDPFQKNRGAQLAIRAEPDDVTGVKRLSVQFENINLRELLTLLADFKGINLMLSDAVEGNTSVRLKNVTWDQALEAILTMKNLSMKQKGDIFFIAPMDEMHEQWEQNASSRSLISEGFYVHYADAAGLADLVKSSNEFLSERGSILPDARSNMLWLKDTPEKIREIKSFLQQADKPARQVRIRAHIVNVDKNSIKELGIKFGTLEKPSITSEAGQLHMDMPVSIQDMGHFSIAIAKLGSDVLLNLELSALEKEGRAQMISNPELVTANRQAASIESGQEIPYQESTSSGATNTVFKKAVLSLKVTPVVMPDNKILLNLAVNQDKVSPLVVHGMPAVNKQEIQTQVLVGNGETIVLGGIYEENISTAHERVPFLASIPVLGALFKNKISKNEQKELLIFVQPEVLS